MRAAWLVLALGVAVAHAALCADGVNICSDVSQFCCCAGGPPVCICCALATDACVAGACVPASASPTRTPSLTMGVTASQSPSQTPTITRSPSTTPSTTRSASPSRTPSLSTGATPSSSAAPSPSACAVAGIAVTACNASIALIVGDTVVTAPLQVPSATQIVVDGSLTVAAPVTFAVDAPPVIVLNGSLSLAGDVLVRAGGNATRVVLFVVDGGDIEVAANFSASTDATCVDAVADRSVRGEFAVLLVPSAQKSCGGRRASSSSPTALWALTAIGGAACVCAVVCVVVAVVAALFAYRFHALRWLFNERERADDSIVHNRIARGSGRDRAM